MNSTLLYTEQQVLMSVLKKVNLSIFCFGEGDLVETATSRWVSVNKCVEVNVGSQNSVVSSSAKDGDNGLNLPAIVASIVDYNLVEVAFCDAALSQLEVPSEVEPPEVSLVLKHIITRTVWEGSCTLLVVVEINKEVGKVIRASVSTSISEGHYIEVSVTAFP